MTKITWEPGKNLQTDTNQQRRKAPPPQTRGSLPVFCSCSITLNLQSIGWPYNTREGVGCPHRCLHFKRKRNSFTTIDLPLAFRQVRYINNVQQKDPQKEKKNEKWLSLVQSPFLTWHCAKWVVIFFSSFFCVPFHGPPAILLPSELGSIKVLLHSLTAYQNEMESLLKGWQAARRGSYANDSMGWVGWVGWVGGSRCQTSVPGFELQKQGFAAGGLPSSNPFTSCLTVSRVTKK